MPKVIKDILTRKATPEDVVNKPKHYNQYGIECIDSIRASMSQEAFRAVSYTHLRAHET